MEMQVSVRGAGMQCMYNAQALSWTIHNTDWFRGPISIRWMAVQRDAQQGVHGYECGAHRKLVRYSSNISNTNPQRCITWFNVSSCKLTGCFHRVHQSSTSNTYISVCLGGLVCARVYCGRTYYRVFLISGHDSMISCILRSSIWHFTMWKPGCIDCFARTQNRKWFSIVLAYKLFAMFDVAMPYTIQLNEFRHSHSLRYSSKFELVCASDWTDSDRIRKFY